MPAGGSGGRNQIRVTRSGVDGESKGQCVVATSEAGSTFRLPWVTTVATIFAALALLLGFSGVVTGLASASDDERSTGSVTLTDEESAVKPTTDTSELARGDVPGAARGLPRTMTAR